MYLLDGEKILRSYAYRGKDECLFTRNRVVISGLFSWCEKPFLDSGHEDEYEDYVAYEVT